MRLPPPLIKQLEQKILPSLPSDTRGFFQLERLGKEKQAISSEAIQGLEQALPSIIKDTSQIEKMFAVRKGVIDLSLAQTPEERTLATLLFASIDPEQELWQLQTLLLDGCKGLPPPLVTRFLKQLPNIQELSVKGCQQLDDAFLKELDRKEGKKWTLLNLAETAFSPDALLLLLESTENLTSLDLSGIQALQTKHIEKLHNLTHHLRSFTLNGNSHIHGLSIIQFLFTHPEIEELSLCELPQFRSSLLPFLRTHVPHLKRLSTTQDPKEKPVFYDFILIGEFIREHPSLQNWDLTNIRFRVNDVIYAFDDLPEERTEELKLHFREKDVIFPEGYAKELHHDKIMEIQDAFRAKNVLLLL